MSTLKRVLALSLALAMVLSINVFAADFSDKNEFEAVTAEAIDMLVALNILAGFPDGSFQPNETITRAQAAKMIYVICNQGVDDGAVKYAGVNTFHDVEAGSWHEGYVEFCYATGVIIGRGNDSVSGKPVFDPNAAVTGYELAKMLLVVGNYNPNVEGFNDSANWKNNVLRFANNTGLIEDYAVLMSATAPRQWASLMMSNLITKVMWATYLGDSLVTGSTLEQGAELVGVRLMGLSLATGILTQTKTAALGAGWDEDGYSYSIIGGNNFDYNANNAYLGQQVRVIMQRINKNSSSITPANVKVLSVYPTNVSQVTETTLNTIAVATQDNYNDAGGTWATNVTKNGLLDGIKFTINGQAYEYKFNVGQTTTTTVVENYNEFISKFYVNDYTPLGLIATNGDFANAIDLDNFIDSVVDYFKNRKDDIVMINSTGTGAGADQYDYMLIAETNYARVSSLNASRISLTGSVNVSTTIDEVNFTNGTPERNNIVAVTKNYVSGELVYDVRIIEPVTVTATAWTDTSVTLDGTAYKLGNRALPSAVINRNHKTYYIDNGFIVYSTDGTSNDGTAPDDLIIITTVGTPKEDSTDDVSITVKYVNAAGTTATAKYDFGNNTGSISTTEPVRANVSSTPGWTTYGLGYAELSAYIGDRGADQTFLQVVETSNGVYFKKVVSETTYSELTFDANMGAGAIGTAAIEFDAENLMFRTGTATREVSVNAKIYALYTASGATSKSVKVIKASELGDIKVNTADVYGMLYNKDGVISALYLDFGTNPLPDTSATRTYLVITGDAYFSGSSKVYVNAKLPNDETVAINVTKIAGTSSPSLALVNSYKGRMMQYTVSSDAYTLTNLQTSGSDLDGYVYSGNTQITDAGATSFKAGQTYNYDTNTTFYFIQDGAVTVSNEPFFGAANTTFVVSKSVSGSLVNKAVAVIVNGDDKAAVLNNISPKVTAALPEIDTAIIANATPTQLVLTFKSAVDYVPAATVAASGFSVTVNGVSETIAAITPTVATLATPTVTLTIPAVSVGDVVKVSYIVTGTTAKISNTAGDLGSFANLAVTNNVAAVVPPVAGLALATTTNVFNNISLTASVTGAPAGLTYQWYKNGTAIAGATAATFTATTGYNAGDVITVKANATGCTETTAPTSVTLTQAAAPTYTLATGAVLTLTSYNVSIDTASIPADAGTVTVTWTIKDSVGGTKTLTSVGNTLLYAHMTTYMGMLAPANQWTLAAGDEVSYVITSDNYATVTVANSAATQIA